MTRSLHDARAREERPPLRDIWKAAANVVEFGAEFASEWARTLTLRPTRSGDSCTFGP